MRLIGFSRRALETTSDLKTVFDAVALAFRTEEFKFSLDVNQGWDKAKAFRAEHAQERLKKDRGIGFFKEDVVAVGIDNQEFNSTYPIYPHARIDIETMDNSMGGGILQMRDWLILAEKLTTTLDLELAFVLGKNENAAAYHRTPLGVGIGLIKIYWIMCFGRGYSALIPKCARSTSFFIREDLDDTGCKAFVSTQSYADYCSAPPELFERQRREIGDDLFNRLPAERPPTGGAEASWIFSPENIFRFVRFVLRERLRNWRKYQADKVPDYYRSPKRKGGAH